MADPNQTAKLCRPCETVPIGDRVRHTPEDGMTVYVHVGDRATMTIIDPRSFGNGGPEWVMRYGNPESIRYAVASLLESYDYLLSDGITQGEATRRLRLMRAKRKECVASAMPPDNRTAESSAEPT